jgi:hypothetical protein
MRALHLDHVDGGGTKEQAIRRGGTMYYYYLRRPSDAKEKLQILCANCNFVKRAEKREMFVTHRIKSLRTQTVFKSSPYLLEYNRKRRSSPEYRSAERIQNAARIVKYRTDTVMLLGGKCFRCGYSDIRALQLDHVSGGGKKEFRELGKVQRYYYYSKHPEEARVRLQVLCANCNWIKKAENAEVSRLGRPRSTT